MAMPVLTVLIFAPLVGALVTLFLPAGAHRAIRGWATAVTLVPVLLAAWMAAGFQPGRAEFQFVEQVPWVPSLGIDYFVGVDGISFSMLALTAVVFCLAAVASYGIQARVKEYFALFLLLETAVLGVFSALDFILFYLFWELVLIPMYFLIGIWGGERKEYAALKFLLYTMVGSLLMLVGILALWYQTGQTTFAIPEIAAKAPTQVPEAWKGWIFLFLFLGFAVKVPVFPFHTWLPDAHVEAPTPISVILAALLLK
ncbi:MAG: NADH-quinone oxidoreductase subunit M, partial [Clostridia bacterium]|nr:NADH-quinone oxidoreductase subunit M [Clostridia bacterium]